MSNFSPKSVNDMQAAEAQRSAGALFYTTSSNVRTAIRDDLKECNLSREEVALRLSNAVGREITVAQLDAFVAQSKPHRFPAELIPAWVSVTGSPRLLQVLCGEAGYLLATNEDRDFAALGRAALAREKLTQKLWDKK